tara:strand:- start:471 stop:665 length:195 start_codon:yes stop_codon:yes gene_type:complete
LVRYLAIDLELVVSLHEIIDPGHLEREIAKLYSAVIAHPLAESHPYFVSLEARGDDIAVHRLRL